jgi:hypothetical protein
MEYNLTVGASGPTTFEMSDGSFSDIGHSTYTLGVPFLAISAGTFEGTTWSNESAGVNTISGGSFTSCAWVLSSPEHYFTGGNYMDSGYWLIRSGACVVNGGDWGGSWTIALEPAQSAFAAQTAPATLTFQGSGLSYSTESGILTGLLSDGGTISITITLDTSNLNTHLVFASSTDVTFSG